MFICSYVNKLNSLLINNDNTIGFKKVPLREI